jgi:hypothetical protein
MSAKIGSRCEGVPGTFLWKEHAVEPRSRRKFRRELLVAGPVIADGGPERGGDERRVQRAETPGGLAVRGGDHPDTRVAAADQPAEAPGGRRGVSRMSVQARPYGGVSLVSGEADTPSERAARVKGSVSRPPQGADP